jgi:hypothetical protein
VRIENGLEEIQHSCVSTYESYQRDLLVSMELVNNATRFEFDAFGPDQLGVLEFFVLLTSSKV